MCILWMSYRLITITIRLWNRFCLFVCTSVSQKILTNHQKTFVSCLKSRDLNTHILLSELQCIQFDNIFFKKVHSKTVTKLDRILSLNTEVVNFFIIRFRITQLETALFLYISKYAIMIFWSNYQKIPIRSIFTMTILLLDFNWSFDFIAEVTYLPIP